MTIHLISTSDIYAGREEKLMRLLRTVEANTATCEEPIKLFLLLQNCTSEEAERLRAISPCFCTIFSVARQCSLSSARNHVLRFILAQSMLGDEDIVGFPDDDCWFSAAFFSSLVMTLASRPDLRVFFCRCSLQPDETAFTSDEIRLAKVPEIVRLSSSNNVFYKGSVIKEIGLFDANLGLGTPIGGSEDTDFAIRGFLATGAVGFVDRSLIGHPEPSRIYAAKYFQGSIVVLARYADCSAAHMLELLRKICVGLVFMMNGRIGAAYFLRSVIKAARTRSLGSMTESLEATETIQLAQ